MKASISRDEFINSVLPKFTIDDLANAGVQYGHKANKWNPKMKFCIYKKTNKVHIIDIRKTFEFFKRALFSVYKFSKSDKKILFVCTKPQFASIIEEYATKCGQYYVNKKWLGGMLTNWRTVFSSIDTLKTYEEQLNDTETKYTKKEINVLCKNKNKLMHAFGGMLEMRGRPDLVFVLDAVKDRNVIHEANVLGIPVVAIVDTNSDLTGISYPIPGNDDSTRAVRLYCHLMCETILHGIHDDMVESGVNIEALRTKILNDTKAKEKKKDIDLELINRKTKITDNPELGVAIDPLEISFAEIDESINKKKHADKKREHELHEEHELENKTSVKKKHTVVKKTKKDEE